MGVDRFLMVHEHNEGKSEDAGGALSTVNVVDHYLLDFPEDWKPSHPDNQHRVTLLGQPLGVTQCGSCEGCVLLAGPQQEGKVQPQVWINTILSAWNEFHVTHSESAINSTVPLYKVFRCLAESAMSSFVGTFSPDAGTAWWHMGDRGLLVVY